jgi:hypothetical protein
MQHAVAAHNNRLNHLPGYPAAVCRLTTSLRVKQRPIQFDGVTAIRFCGALAGGGIIAVDIINILVGQRGESP